MRFYKATTRNGVTRGSSYGFTWAIFGPIITAFLAIALVIAVPVLLWETISASPALIVVFTFLAATIVWAIWYDIRHAKHG
jgi:hypothetical protein